MDIYKTYDGSSTLYSAEFQEHYHSRREGALSESLYKHVLPALSYVSSYKKNIKVLDICFGLGYNTFATLLYAKEHYPELELQIYSPELDANLIDLLAGFEYPLEFEPIKDVIKKTLHHHTYNSRSINIDIYIGRAEEYVKSLENESIDIVYQDAFSPKKNPTLWSEEFFADIYKICTPKAILTTYSSARVVKDNLKKAGFSVEKHIGEGFSKEGIKAFKTPS
ncbi:MAG: tRNA (5-methylaminomethyl-2-thiouridine)(34)-methyltransferase MnmD [Campylobacterales bacterium]